MGSLEEEAKVWLNREGGGGAVGSKFGQLVVSCVKLSQVLRNLILLCSHDGR